MIHLFIFPNLLLIVSCFHSPHNPLQTSFITQQVVWWHHQRRIVSDDLVVTELACACSTTMLRRRNRSWVALRDHQAILSNLTGWDERELGREFCTLSLMKHSHSWWKRRLIIVFCCLLFRIYQVKCEIISRNLIPSNKSFE